MPKDQGLEKFKQALDSVQIEDPEDIFKFFRHVVELSKGADFPEGIKVRDLEYTKINLGAMLGFNSKKYGKVSIVFDADDNLKKIKALSAAISRGTSASYSEYLREKITREDYEAQKQKNTNAKQIADIAAAMITNIFRWSKIDEAGNETKKLFTTIEEAYQDQATREIISEIAEQILDHQLALEPQKAARVAAATSDEHEEDDSEKIDPEKDFEGILQDVEKYKGTIAYKTYNSKGEDLKVEISSDFLEKMSRLMKRAFQTREFQPEKEKNYVIDDTYFSLKNSGKLLLSDSDGVEVDLPINNTSQNFVILPAGAHIIMSFAENLVDFLNSDAAVEVDSDNQVEIDDEEYLRQVVESDGKEGGSMLPKLNLKAVFRTDEMLGHIGKKPRPSKPAHSSDYRQFAAPATKKMTYGDLEKMLGKENSLNIGNGIVINLQSLDGMKVWNITENNVPISQELHDPEAIIENNIITNAATLYLATQRQAGFRPSSPQGSQFDQSAGQKRGPTQ